MCGSKGKRERGRGEINIYLFYVKRKFHLLFFSVAAQKNPLNLGQKKNTLRSARKKRRCERQDEREGEEEAFNEEAEENDKDRSAGRRRRRRTHNDGSHQATSRPRSRLPPSPFFASAFGFRQ